MTTDSELVDRDENAQAPGNNGGQEAVRAIPRSRHGLAVVIYIALTVALTWPLTWHVASRIVIHPKLTWLAPYYHMYLVAWYHHAFDQGLADYWNCNIHYPHPRVLTYFESLVAPAAMTWPVHLITQNATLCYNLVALTAFVLNGLSVYVLALQLGLSWRLALLTGATVAFCPYMFGEIYCLATLLLYPAPFLLAAIYRLIRRPTWLGTILVGVCGVWLTLTCYQYTLFCSLFCAAWVLWFVRQMPWRRLWYKLLIVGAVSGALVLPVLVTVKRTHREMGFYHGPALPMSWLQMILPATHQRFYHDALGINVREERGDLDPVVCFPGVTFGLLAAVGTWAALFGSATDDEARRRRHAYRFCLVAGPAAVILSMGLWIHLGPIRVPGPYALLFMTLSPFGSVRSVYRFYIFGQLFAAILGGLGLRQCLNAASTKAGKTAIVLATVVFLLIESLWLPLETRPAPGRPSDVDPLYKRLAEIDPNAPLIELPIPPDVKRAPLDALYTIDTIHTWQPLVNGFASFVPGLYESLRETMATFPSFETIRYLRALGVRYVIVREGIMPQENVERIRRFPSLQKIRRHEGAVLYALTDSQRQSLNDWDGKTSFRIEPDAKSKDTAQGLVAFELDLRKIIPVLPGDRATRWRVTWQDASGRAVLTQEVGVRDSHWLTFKQNALSARIDLPKRAGAYTVEAIDLRDARKLGECTFHIK